MVDMSKTDKKNVITHTWPKIISVYVNRLQFKKLILYAINRVDIYVKLKLLNSKKLMDFI